MEQIITCINCPVGCRMTVTLDENRKVVSVQGNSCIRGRKYAEQECTLPLRMITAVIPLENREMPLSVKTAEPVPKHLIPEVMESIREIHVSAPVSIGQVLLRDVCHTGVDIIATRPVS